MKTIFKNYVAHESARWNKHPFLYAHLTLGVGIYLGFLLSELSERRSLYRRF